MPSSAGKKKPEHGARRGLHGARCARQAGRDRLAVHQSRRVLLRLPGPRPHGGRDDREDHGAVTPNEKENTMRLSTAVLLAALAAAPAYAQQSAGHDFFFLVVRRPPGSTLFPYTTLFR